jgi:glycosyltransferase involved in cell wall biosynthesis
VIVAITMVRDEADILPWTFAHMLDQVDHVIVADNGSVDGTRDMLTDPSLDGRVTVIDDPEVGYYQARKMTALAHQAGEIGADWVVPFDADEAFWLPVLAAIDADVINVRSYVHVPHRTDDAAELNPIRRIRYRLFDREPFPKVVYRYHPKAKLAQGNHSVKIPGARTIEAGSMRHYQYRSLDQVKRKVRQGTTAYKATNLPVTEGAHWRQLAALDDDQLAAWWDAYTSQPLVYDPA